VDTASLIPVQEEVIKALAGHFKEFFAKLKRFHFSPQSFILNLGSISGDAKK